MKTLLKTEELAQLLACMAALAVQGVPWWAWVLLVLGPDIGMLGYLVGPRTGAVTYNLLHHKGTALLLVGFGLGSAWLTVPMGVSAHAVLIAGIILYGHSSMDRLFGFGLKHSDGFQHTHLGWIGKAAPGKSVHDR